MSASRVLKLSEASSPNGQCVVYVMARDQRLHDNHALLNAQATALERKQPIYIVFNLLSKSGVRRREHYEFMMSGLKEAEQEARNHNIGFVIANTEKSLSAEDALTHLRPSAVYFDFSPLRGPRSLQKSLSKTLNCESYVVDTHNIVPVWILSDKEEFAAHTIRSKVHHQLENWLIAPNRLTKHPHAPDNHTSSLSWQHIDALIRQIPANNGEYAFKSGETAAHDALRDFIENRLDSYAENRNQPTLNGQSNLSPYLHFGQLSALRVALEVSDAIDEPPLILKRAKLASFEGKPTRADSVNAFLEELIVRKELADNYCFYNSDYDKLGGARDWARQTLLAHEEDSRQHVYTRDKWEAATTHDEAWNAAQQEMMQTGKMHGYMRMYWAKKILEWSATPQEAIQTAIYLNDTYSLDGGDPNGYTGIMWSIAGVHDRPWFERDVYGKIRYMNRGGLERRFDVAAYIGKWT